MAKIIAPVRTPRQPQPYNRAMAEVIRDAEERDLERVLELYGQLAPSGDSPEPGNRRQSLAVLGEIANRDGVRLLVLEADGRVEGSVVLVIVPNLTHGGRPWAVIEHMIVDESRQGTGMGRRLLRAVEEIVVEAGCYKLQFLSAWRRKDTAHPFYEAMDYESPARGFRKHFG